MNEVSVIMESISQNESFARIVVSGFIAPLDPTVGELNDVKTAVSEAVTNAIIHGYEGKSGKIHLNLKADSQKVVTIEVLDNGIGILDISEARAPLYTSKPEMERSGMGFTVMETFMDSIEIFSESGKGTKVTMTKKIGASA